MGSAGGDCTPPALTLEGLNPPSGSGLPQAVTLPPELVGGRLPLKPPERPLEARYPDLPPLVPTAVEADGRVVRRAYCEILLADGDRCITLMTAVYDGPHGKEPLALDYKLIERRPRAAAGGAS